MASASCYLIWSDYKYGRFDRFVAIEIGACSIVRRSLIETVTAEEIFAKYDVNKSRSLERYRIEHYLYSFTFQRLSCSRICADGVEL